MLIYGNTFWNDAVCFTWHTDKPFGEMTEEFNNRCRTGDELNFVQADGDELELILECFKNLPIANTRVMTWYGDHAKFILRHLPHAGRYKISLRDC